MKVGDCILIKPKDKWLCVKYYSHDYEHIRYVPMSVHMLSKRHIRKMKYDTTKIRSIYQGRGEKPIKGVDGIKWEKLKI